MPQKIKVACVCSAWLEVAGQSGDTVAARKRFIDDHRECREKLDAEIKQNNLHQGIDAVTRTMQ